jgi:alkylhydroperoxidase family enzyme
MSRIAPVDPATAPAEIRAAHDELIKTHALSNMKAVLLHSPVALNAVLEWYALFEQITPVIGKRGAVLLCFAISKANACELCTTFMRREIIGWGEDPEGLTLTETEQVLWDFGQQLARDANRVDDALYARLAAAFTPRQIIDLTVFGGLMIVNNLFNSALRIDVDQSLDPFRIDPEHYFI